jgi:hypothetical protein
MSKRALMALMIAGLLLSAGFAGLVGYSLIAGSASVAIPICMLVVGPALAAVAMVATCSAVAPPAQQLAMSVEESTDGTNA